MFVPGISMLPNCGDIINGNALAGGLEIFFCCSTGDVSHM